MSQVAYNLSAFSEQDYLDFLRFLPDARSVFALQLFSNQTGNPMFGIDVDLLKSCSPELKFNYIWLDSLGRPFTCERPQIFIEMLINLDEDRNFVPSREEVLAVAAELNKLPVAHEVIPEILCLNDMVHKLGLK